MNYSKQIVILETHDTKMDKKDAHYAIYSYSQIILDVHVVKQNLEQDLEVNTFGINCKIITGFVIWKVIITGT